MILRYPFYRAPEGADGGGAANTATGSADAAAGNAAATNPAESPWYSGVSHEALKGVVTNFKTEKEFLDALGYEPATDNGPWYGEVDEELRKVAERFTSPADALRYAAEARKRESRAYVPGKDATDEEKAKYYKALGVPESPDKYKFPEVPAEQLTEELKASRSHWAKIFHDNRLSTAQAEALLTAFDTEQKALLEQAKKDDAEFVKQSEAQLRSEWKGDAYERNVTLADRALTELSNRAGVPVAELRNIETKEGRFLLDDPRVVRLIAVVGREMAEGTLGGVVSTDERDTLEEQITDLRKKADEAKERGDSKTANQFYQQSLALRGKLTNRQPIVGSQGRVA